MIQQLLDKYSYAAIQSGNELYFPLSVAIEIVSDCTVSGLVVAGVEFFHIAEGKITPVVAPLNGLDCSDVLEEQKEWSLLIKQCNSAAISVLEFEAERDDSQYVNLTVLSHDDMPV
ncbi:hypothetical protein [Sulfoacidibacillus thermotolerans]|uniref:Uncharacterized protein n=1 Tax=Sulfoacidibacillus thermotolerans TaxID=1765684 RepID=A0A2U3D921_SULT2|nr:hypothetical protein [Sulfoacidibacillus thermotolerans]PWI57777.1 hypothetical protein BM613_07295 [Sulfoacidibacillus thermotolerans]